MLPPAPPMTPPAPSRSGSISRPPPGPPTTPSPGASTNFVPSTHHRSSHRSNRGQLLVQPLRRIQSRYDMYLKFDEKDAGAGSEEDSKVLLFGSAANDVHMDQQQSGGSFKTSYKAVLEPAMQGHDMIGRAKIGAGKTLAFGIPIPDKIIQFQKKHGRGKNPLALVLAPTRELAKQVEKELQESAPVDTICVYGGSPIQQQMRALDYGVDVVVGTPGRVIDLLNRGALVLADVQFLVLDEADEMLNVGFAVAVENILEKLPLQRQTLMFSATMPP